MILDEPQIEHYFREGYVLVRGLAPREAVDEVRSVAEQAAQGNLQAHLDHGGQLDTWRPVGFDLSHPERNDPRVHRLLWEPRVVEAVTQLLACEPRVNVGMLAMLPPRGGKGLPWHQDAQYTHVIGGALNAFIAVGRITPEMGNLWVAPQSHRMGLQPSKISQSISGGHREAVIEPTNGTCLPTLEPGDACIFNRLTYHRSLRNDTDEPRFAYAAQYNALHARDATTGKINPKHLPVSELIDIMKTSGVAA